MVDMHEREWVAIQEIHKCKRNCIGNASRKR